VKEAAVIVMPKTTTNLPQTMSECYRNPMFYIKHIGVWSWDLRIFDICGEKSNGGFIGKPTV
jgi:hypothetical protein